MENVSEWDIAKIEEANPISNWQWTKCHNDCSQIVISNPIINKVQNGSVHLRQPAPSLEPFLVRKQLKWIRQFRFPCFFLVVDWIFYLISQIILTMIFILMLLRLAIFLNGGNFLLSAIAWKEEKRNGKEKHRRQDDFFEAKISKSLTLDNNERWERCWRNEESFGFFSLPLRLFGVGCGFYVQCVYFWICICTCVCVLATISLWDRMWESTIELKKKTGIECFHRHLASILLTSTTHQI